ncbi:hypothetical protein AMC83_CH01933 [Rhizobium phaseoli]|uniref:hypothetical protein n=1 Tax=Rhizobium phaseoli TaxID=396 RepID=UPI0007EBDA8B|nr:hypothetical protein [Rhizobium phaseoli]ANL71916.1 hypothetical protein AMC83_CH01933 [Rhizobium phaseoli]
MAVPVKTVVAVYLLGALASYGYFAQSDWLTPPTGNRVDQAIIAFPFSILWPATGAMRLSYALWATAKN